MIIHCKSIVLVILWTVHAFRGVSADVSFFPMKMKLGEGGYTSIYLRVQSIAKLCMHAYTEYVYDKGDGDHCIV